MAPLTKVKIVHSQNVANPENYPRYLNSIFISVLHVLVSRFLILYGRLVLYEHSGSIEAAANGNLVLCLKINYFYKSNSLLLFFLS